MNCNNNYITPGIPLSATLVSSTTSSSSAMGSLTSTNSSSSTASMSAGVLSRSVTSASNQALPSTSLGVVTSLPNAPSIASNTSIKTIHARQLIYSAFQQNEFLTRLEVGQRIELMYRITLSTSKLSNGLSYLMQKKMICKDQLSGGKSTQYTLCPSVANNEEILSLLNEESNQSILPAIQQWEHVISSSSSSLPIVPATPVITSSSSSIAASASASASAVPLSGNVTDVDQYFNENYWNKSNL